MTTLESNLNIDRRKSAVLFTICIFFASVICAIQKGLLGIPALEVLFIQYFVSFLFFAPLALKEGIGPLKSRRPGLLIVRSLSGAVGTLMFLIAVKRMLLVDAVLLSYTTPLFIPLVAWIWMRQQVSRLLWICLVVGLVGAYLIIKPTKGFLMHPEVALPLFAAVFFAISLIAIHQLTSTESMISIMFYNSGITSLVMMPFCIMFWKWPDFKQLITLCVIGILYAVMSYFNVKALQMASASYLAPFWYTSALFSQILGWIFFKEKPDWMSLCGIVLISAAGIQSMKAGQSIKTS
jgi:drug/metabolite transporter (DMT)-like permease